MHNHSLQRFLWLSVAAAIATIGLKSGAYWLTGSVGLLSDALEQQLHQALRQLTVFTHLEPQEDPRSHADRTLDRTFPITTGNSV